MGINSINTWAKSPNEFYMKIEHKKGGDEIVLKSRTGLQAVATFFDRLFHKNNYRLQTIIQHLKHTNIRELPEETRRALEQKINTHNVNIRKYPTILKFFKSFQIDSPFTAIPSENKRSASTAQGEAAPAGTTLPQGPARSAAPDDTVSKLNEAETRYRELIRLNPENSKAHYKLGNVLDEQDKFDEAKACYLEAIRLNPEDDDAYNNLGIVLEKQDEFDEAEASYREAVRLNPENRNAQYNLGILLYEQDDFDEAEACFREVIRLDPEDSDAHSYLGIVLEEQGNLDEAEACYREAIRLNPEDDDAQNNLDTILEKMS